MTITEFLLARLAEDEAAAREVQAAAWEVNGDGLVVVAGSSDQVCPGGGINYDEPPEPSDAAHIARHDPARVLREVEAKRAIVEVLGDCDDGLIWDAHLANRAEDALRHLASVYSDHEDYRAEWVL